MEQNGNSIGRESNIRFDKPSTQFDCGAKGDQRVFRTPVLIAAMSNDARQFDGKDSKKIISARNGVAGSVPSTLAADVNISRVLNESMFAVFDVMEASQPTTQIPLQTTQMTAVGERLAKAFQVRQ